jgi:hypothetical protein
MGISYFVALCTNDPNHGCARTVEPQFRSYGRPPQGYCGDSPIGWITG